MTADPLFKQTSAWAERDSKDQLIA
jgi:hypothetical protein